MRRGRSSVANTMDGRVSGRSAARGPISLETRPFYEEIGVGRFAVLAGLLIVSVSAWFFWAATVRVAVIPPDALFYVIHLPAGYCLRLVQTLALLPDRTLVFGRLW